MGGWSHGDTAKETGSSSSEASAAAHQARDDATKSGDFERGNSDKNSRSFSRDDESGKEATGFWGSIFGKNDD
jgi:hypothetical protein